MLFGREKDTEELRQELIDDCYACAFGAGFGEALMEVSDIEDMSDEEVRKEAGKRGLL